MICDKDLDSGQETLRTLQTKEFQTLSRVQLLLLSGDFPLVTKKFIKMLVNKITCLENSSSGPQIYKDVQTQRKHAHGQKCLTSLSVCHAAADMRRICTSSVKNKMLAENV